MKSEKFESRVTQWMDDNLSQEAIQDKDLRYKVFQLLVLPDAASGYAPTSDEDAQFHTNHLDTVTMRLVSDLTKAGIQASVVGKIIEQAFSFESVTDKITPKAKEFLETSKNEPKLDAS